MNTYRNKFYSPNVLGSTEFISTSSTPILFNGFLIYHRVKSARKDANVFDIVKNGVCVGMYAGIDGAKEACILLSETNTETHVHNEQVCQISFLT